MRSVLTVTMNPAVDLSFELGQVIADRKLRCHNLRQEPGGGGINVSRAIRILGGESTSFFFSGGSAGRELDSLLQSFGIDDQPVEVGGETRRNLTALETSSGRQFRFVMPGPEVGEEDCVRLLNKIAAHRPKPAYLVASGSLPPGAPDDFFARLALLGAELGARVVVDTSGEPLCQAARTGVYLLKPNLPELKQLAGKDVDSEEAQAEAAHRLIESGSVEVVIVSMGGSGALLVTGTESRRIRAPVVPIKSRVGAGDSMVGAVVFSLARGENLFEAVCRGVAAGAAAVMTPGTELCRKEDADHLYRGLLQDSGGKVEYFPDKEKK